jgi:hypothetical protein
VITKRDDNRVSVLDAGVMSQSVTDSEPESVSRIREKLQLTPDARPCEKASDEAVRLPVVTESNDSPDESAADDTTGFVVSVSSPLNITVIAPLATSDASVFTPTGNTVTRQSSPTAACRMTSRSVRHAFS